MSRRFTEKIIDQFIFTRRDQVSILVLVLAIILSFYIPDLFRSRQSAIPLSTLDSLWINTARDSTGIQANMDLQDQAFNFQRQYSDRKTLKSEVAADELFYFDPNTLSQEGWKKLGLRTRTIATIMNYLAKGGRFKQAEDVSRIYGFPDDDFERLKHYIRIEHQVSSYPGKPSASTSSGKKPIHIKPVDINLADTSAFIALPGIGSKLAGRIVQFREKLGGFYSVDQLAEIYGLRDSTFQKIRPYLVLEDPVVKRININIATVDELKAHPYIRYNLAAPIVAYRNEHGSFKSVEEVKNVMAVTDDIYKKLVPYLEV